MGLNRDIPTVKQWILEKLATGPQGMTALQQPRTNCDAKTRDLALAELSREGKVIVKTLRPGLKAVRVAELKPVDLSKAIERASSVNGYTKSPKGTWVRTGAAVKPNQPLPLSEKVRIEKEDTHSTKVTLQAKVAVMQSEREKPLPEDVVLENEHYSPVKEEAITIPLEEGFHILSYSKGCFRLMPLKRVSEPARYQLLEEENERLQTLNTALEEKLKKVHDTWGALVGLIDNKSLV